VSGEEYQILLSKNFSQGRNEYENRELSGFDGLAESYGFSG
jgi:hypothetical protein